MTFLTSDLTGPEPFDDPAADFVLRSSDGVSFRVYRAILSAASPVFRGMFSIPQPSSPPTASAEEVPTVDLPEDSTALDTLLRYIYPITKPRITSLEDATAILRVGAKYDVISVHAVRDSLHRFTERDPLGTYAVASSFGFGEEARAAARATLRLTLDELPDSASLALISGRTYHRLVTYHRRCGAAAAELSSSDSIPDWLPMQYLSNGGSMSAYVQCNFHVEYRERVANVLRGRPWGRAVLAQSVLWPCVQKAFMYDTKGTGAQALQAYSELLSEQVDKVTAQVSFDCADWLVSVNETIQIGATGVGF